jgi:hypothetical protein
VLLDCQYMQNFNIKKKVSLGEFALFLTMLTFLKSSLYNHKKFLNFINFTHVRSIYSIKKKLGTNETFGLKIYALIFRN